MKNLSELPPPHASHHHRICAQPPGTGRSLPRWGSPDFRRSRRWQPEPGLQGLGGSRPGTDRHHQAGAALPAPGGRRLAAAAGSSPDRIRRRSRSNTISCRSIPRASTSTIRTCTCSRCRTSTTTSSCAKGCARAIDYPHFAEHIGLFLAKTLGETSDLVLDYRTKKEMVGRFINPELCKITEDLDLHRAVPRDGAQRLPQGAGAAGAGPASGRGAAGRGRPDEREVHDAGAGLAFTATCTPAAS